MCGWSSGNISKIVRHGLLLKVCSIFREADCTVSLRPLRPTFPHGKDLSDQVRLGVLVSQSFSVNWRRGLTAASRGDQNFTFAGLCQTVLREMQERMSGGFIMKTLVFGPEQGVLHEVKGLAVVETVRPFTSLRMTNDSTSAPARMPTRDWNNPPAQC